MGTVGNKTLLIALTAAAVVLLLTACGSGNGTPGIDPAESSAKSEPVATEQLPALVEVTMRPQAVAEPGFKTTSLAAPSALDLGLPSPRQVSDIGDIITVAAAGYDAALPSHNVQQKGGYALFEADWPKQPPRAIEEAAYCMYTINVAGYSGEPTLSIVWADTAYPMANGEQWTGLANYMTNTWDFFEGPRDQVITLESLEPYVSPSDTVVVVPVVTWAGRVVILRELKVGASEVRATGYVEGDVRFDITYPEFYCGELPESVDLAPTCAPVGDQGTWGACMVFGIVNGAYNQELSRIYNPLGWDPDNPANQTSSKYIYIETGKFPGAIPTYTEGRGSDDILTALSTMGVPTELNAPYDLVYDDDWSTAALADAEVLNIEDSVDCDMKPLVDINSIKHVLAHRGQVAFMSCMLDEDFKRYDGSYVWDFSSEPYMPHGLAVVGYDDSLQAFKVRNSWSTEWGDDGHIWVAYEVFENELAYVRAGYLVDDYDPAVARRFLETELELPPPVNVRATTGSRHNAVCVTWDVIEEPLYFRISRDTVDNVIAETDTRKWNDTVGDFLTHSYWVTAVYADGESMPSSPAAGFRKQATPEITDIYPQRCPTGNYVTFEPRIEGSGVSEYYWDFGSGFTPRFATVATPSVLAGEPGVYAVSLTITDYLGSHTFDDFIRIVTDTTPDGRFEYQPDPVWYGTEITFDTQSSDSGDWITLYEWDWDGDGTYDQVTGEDVVTHTYQNPGTYTVTLRITDCEGLTNTWSDDVIVLDDNNAPVVSWEVMRLDSPSQPPVRVLIDAGDTFDYEDDIALYEWDLDGDGTFDVNEKHRTYAVHTYTEHDRVPVTVRVTDEQGLSAEVTKTLKVGFGETIPGWRVHGISKHYLSMYNPVLATAVNDGLPGILCMDTSGNLWLTEAAAVPDEFGDWVDTRIEINGHAAEYMVSLAYDDLGRPLVTYHTDEQNPGLHLGIRDDSTGWLFSNVHLSTGNDVGMANCIEFVNGEMVVSYSVHGNGDWADNGLFHARTALANPTGPADWETLQIIQGNIGFRWLSAAHIDGRPAIAFGEVVESDKRRVNYTGAASATPADGESWTNCPLHDPVTVTSRWSVVDLGGRPLVALLSWDDSSSVSIARAATASPAASADWTWTTLPTPDEIGRQVDLAVVDGIPWAVTITGYEPNYVTVHQASGSDPSSAADWTSTTLCTGDYRCARIIAVDNRPAIILYCAEDYCLYYLTPED